MVGLLPTTPLADKLQSRASWGRAASPSRATMGRSQEGCAASQSRPWRLRAQRRATRWTQEDAVLQDLEERCAVPAERLRLVADAMVTEMRVGLSAAAEDGSLLKMLVTYVDSLPSGIVV